MIKDIFIDNNIASKFCFPKDPEYVKLTKWLINYEPDDHENKNKNNYAHLVVSQKILTEYLRSSAGCPSGTSMPSIIDKMTREGRLIKVSNEQIKKFNEKICTKAIRRKLRSNDVDHFPLVLFSYRKFALTYDQDFSYDIQQFPGYDGVIACSRPEDIPYE